MTEHSNASLVRRFFDAQAAGDLVTLLEILSEEIVSHLPTGATLLSESPTVVGLNQLAEMSGRNVDASDGTFRFEVERVFAGDHYAAVLTHNTAITSGRSLDLHMVIQFKLDEGKIVEVWESPDDIDVLLNFWRDQ